MNENIIIKQDKRISFALLVFALAGTIPCQAATILDSSFETLGAALSPSGYRYGPAPSGMSDYLEKFTWSDYPNPVNPALPNIPPGGNYGSSAGGPLWGGWWGSSSSTANTWRHNGLTNQAWQGGAIAMTEDYTTGWKWAQEGRYFGIIQNRLSMSQFFTASSTAQYTLNWFDANRSSWRDNESFGRENSYSVTVRDVAANTIQTVGNYTSQLGAGSFANSQTDTWDLRFSAAGKQTWFAKSAQNAFNLEAGKQYVLSFNSLSPTNCDAFGLNSNGCLADPNSIDDRATLLDNVRISIVPTGGTTDPIPEPGTMGLLSLALMGIGWRLRRKRSEGTTR